jgi:hypothetical protein
MGDLKNSCSRRGQAMDSIQERILYTSQDCFSGLLFKKIANKEDVLGENLRVEFLELGKVGSMYGGSLGCFVLINLYFLFILIEIGLQ